MTKAVERTEFRGLSERAKSLLNVPEGIDIEWKRDNKVDAEDLVAFANSPDGGVLLLGVEQIDGPKGTQRPRISGCRIGDNAVLEVMNKALDCLPPIHTRVFTENLAEKPFLRVEIPSGEHKPYCTKSGVYKVRVQNRSAPLSPPQLLAILMEVEGKKFIDNFRKATSELTSSLSSMEADLKSKMAGLESDMGRAAQDVGSHAEGLQMNLTDVVDQVTDAIGEVAGKQEMYTERQFDELNTRFRYLETAVAALLQAHQLEDAVTLYWRPRVHRHIDALRAESKRMTRRAIFESIRDFIRGNLLGECEDELLHKLCVEKLGEFPMPSRPPVRW